jgi:hypothetical protein
MSAILAGPSTATIADHPERKKNRKSRGKGKHQLTYSRQPTATNATKRNRQLMAKL